MTFRALMCLLILTIFSGCALHKGAEAPICLEPRPHLEAVAVADQRAMRDASPTGFEVIAVNTKLLQGHIRLLEQKILLHDGGLRQQCPE